TSVLVDYSRAKGTDPKLNRLILALPLCVCGMIRAEMLAGARTPAERGTLVAFLDRLGLTDTEEDIWDVLGDNLRAVRRAGLTLPFPDVLIATVAIDAGVELWTRDGHFAQVQAVLPGLRLFPEPP
ncbi:MAG: PIN domain-containing protein, partial [Fimbriiglobus sp.]